MERKPAAMAAVETRSTEGQRNIHTNLMVGIAGCLKDIFHKGVYADVAVKVLLKSNPKWGAHDRRYLAETVYDMVRGWRLLWHLLKEEPSSEMKNLIELVRFFNSTDLIAEKKKIGNRAIRESIPDWLDGMGESEVGDGWNDELSALNGSAPVVLRVNTLKTSKQKLIAQLKTEGVDTRDYSMDTTQYPDALMLEKRQNIFGTPSFQSGMFEVQDAASQYVAYFAGVKPGMRVVDACAGGGGKSLHLAARMGNKGKIIAMDVAGWKLQELRQRAARAGVDVIETRTIDSSKVIKRILGTADILLLDVPCSGVGVLRRNPDAKWKLTPESIERVRQQQKDILQNYWDITKVGGALVYVTCSLFRSENEDPINDFLKTMDGKFEKTEEKKFSPFKDGTDGFYMAKSKRIE